VLVKPSPEALAALKPEVREELEALFASPEKLAALQKSLIRHSWMTGQLDYKLHATQKLIDSAIRGSARRKFYLLCSRRLGKSFYLLLRLFKKAIQKPGSRLLYLAPWAKDAADIANDLAAQILNDCPADLKPVYSAQQKEFVFPRVGSIIRLKGVNGEHARYLRGGAQDEIVLDECGQMDNLASVVSDVCLPMVLTTRGLVLLATTPPTSPGHESARMYEELAAEASAVKFTMRDAPHISDEAKAELLIEVGEDRADLAEILAGTKPPKSTTARRELFCEFVTDSDLAVIPEFTAAAKAEIVREHPRPTHYDAYTVMDPGMVDRTGILFAYWDFLQAKLVIEDELLLKGPNTQTIAREVLAKEEALWNGRNVVRYLDCSGDGGKRLIADLWSAYRLRFGEAYKHDMMAGIHLMRSSVQRRELVINPRCTNLIRQMENAIWNNRGNDFAREGEKKIDGHFDLVSALRYLTRSVNRGRNPYPEGHYLPGGPLGPARDAYISRKNAPKPKQGLYADTPVGKKLAKSRRKRK
jgi:hypothetical protein